MLQASVIKIGEVGENQLIIPGLETKSIQSISLEMNEIINHEPDTASEDIINTHNIEVDSVFV